MKSDINFETALSKLENIVKTLETGNIGLNESINLYEEGIELSAVCTKMLDEAKQKVEVIKNTNYTENEFENLSED